MAYEMKEGQGSLFVNDRKNQENHPDYKGQVKINGQEFWISAWIKNHDQRGDWLSLSVQPKDQQERSAPAQSPAKPRMLQKQKPLPASEDMDQDIPF